jgi:hypothetical protein
LSIKLSRESPSSMTKNSNRKPVEIEMQQSGAVKESIYGAANRSRDKLVERIHLL